MMGCSVQGEAGETEHEVQLNDEPCGILKSHAYGIIDVIELPDPKCNNTHKSHRLLRIRNPWGRKEWNQKWSDGSPKYLENLQKLNEHLKERAKGKEYQALEPEADDGTFLMCYKDWRTVYNNLYCCVKFDDQWSGQRIVENWTAENSGGTPMKPEETALKNWAKNPQFIVDLKAKNEKNNMFVTLGQDDGRLIRGMRFPFKDNINASCFTVMKLAANEKKAPIFDQKKVVKLSMVKEYRDNAVEIAVPPGTYTIVPSTTKAGMTGKFYINVYHECPK